MLSKRRCKWKPLRKIWHVGHSNQKKLCRQTPSIGNNAWIVLVFKCYLCSCGCSWLLGLVDDKTRICYSIFVFVHLLKRRGHMHNHMKKCCKSLLSTSFSFVTLGRRCNPLSLLVSCFLCLYLSANSPLTLRL